MSWEKWEDAEERGPEALVLKFVMVICLFAVLIGGIGFIAYPSMQGGNVIKKTLDSDNVIYNYEWFKKQYRAVEAIDEKIALQTKEVETFQEMAGERSDWTFEDKTEYSRLRSVCIGLEQQRADVVADYNAKASMANRQIFMGKDCPPFIK